MSTSEPVVAPSIPWGSLVSRASEEVLSKIQKEKPEFLTDTFLEPMKFLPITLSSRELIDMWLQSEKNRIQVAKVCHKEVKDITKDCVETGAAFICLKVEKPNRIPRPVPDKTLVIIALGQLRTANGIFRGVDLAQGGSVIISGDEPQVFDGGRKGGGFGLVLRVKFKCLST